MKTSLVVYSTCENAGDVLIENAIRKLFENDLNFKIHAARNDVLDNLASNIIIGPGGLLSGSYRPDVSPDEMIIKFLNKDLLSTLSEKNIFFFGTGTNTSPLNKKTEKPFSKYSGEVLRKLFSLSKGIYLRGSSDINRLQRFSNLTDYEKFKFQPCPSIFLKRLYNLSIPKEDKIALNLPLGNIDVRKTALPKFVEFAHSLGLTVTYVDNHPKDFNPSIYDVFDDCAHSYDMKKQLSSDNQTSISNIYVNEWGDELALVRRYAGYRFAFGQRLHAFLPFLAFSTPSVFLTSSPIRQTMPYDYFRNNIFLSKTSYSVDKLESLVNTMIVTLGTLIRREAYLIHDIEDHIGLLWDISMKNKYELLSHCN